MSSVGIGKMSGALAGGQFPALVGGRIPSLDGLRALAVFLVITSHLTGGLYRLPFLGTGRFPTSPTSGFLGVHIFFVLSGFLITTLLLQEKEKRGQISLRQFYIRRSLRILPASYAFLMFLLLATAVNAITVPRESFIASFFYFRNYVGGDWYTGHLWSLSVEEQFYLLWPALMVLFGKRGAVILALCSLPLADLMHLFNRPWTSFEMNMDALACGCILASVWEPLGRSRRWQSFLRSGFFWIVPISVFILDDPQFHGRIVIAAGKIVTNILVAISVERFVRYPSLGVAKLLNLQAVAFIGTLSYSLYLWQEPFVFMNRGRGLLQTFPFNVAIACTCAFLSYRLIERPFLRLKDRWRTASPQLSAAELAVAVASSSE